MLMSHMVSSQIGHGSDSNMTMEVRMRILQVSCILLTTTNAESNWKLIFGTSESNVFSASSWTLSSWV